MTSTPQPPGAPVIDSIAPIFAFSGSDRSRRGLEETPWHDEFMTWLTANGIDPAVTTGIEVYQTPDGLVGKVVVYQTNEDGKVLTDPPREETVPLSSMPPNPPPFFRYVSRPVEVNAVRLSWRNVAEVAAWVAHNSSDDIVAHIPDRDDPTDRAWIDIPTLEGVMRANQGDLVIRGTEGEFYPCKDSVFQRKYALINAGAGR